MAPAPAGRGSRPSRGPGWRPFAPAPAAQKRQKRIGTQATPQKIRIRRSAQHGRMMSVAGRRGWTSSMTATSTQSLVPRIWQENLLLSCKRVARNAIPVGCSLAKLFMHLPGEQSQRSAINSILRFSKPGQGLISLPAVGRSDANCPCACHSCRWKPCLRRS